MIGFDRIYCKNLASVVSPMIWLSCSRKVTNLIFHANVLMLLQSLTVDASDVKAGAVLLQEGDDTIDHPVAHFSKKHQNNYSTIEKEALTLVLAIQHFVVYIAGGSKPLQVFTDHNPLTFIGKMKNKNHRILNWSLLLQEHNLCINHIKGCGNIIADALSRC